MSGARQGIGVLQGQRVLLPPSAQLAEERTQGQAKLRERVLDPRRYLRKYLSTYDRAFLQIPELGREHAVGDAREAPLELVEPQRPVEEQSDDHRLPFAADEIESRLDGAFGVTAFTFDGHRHVRGIRMVTTYLRSAFLNDTRCAVWLRTHE